MLNPPILNYFHHIVLRNGRQGIFPKQERPVGAPGESEVEVCICALPQIHLQGPEGIRLHPGDEGLLPDYLYRAHPLPQTNVPSTGVWGQDGGGRHEVWKKKWKQGWGGWGAWGVGSYKPNLPSLLALGDTEVRSITGKLFSPLAKTFASSTTMQPEEEEDTREQSPITAAQRTKLNER